jgi:NhaP-type Na+/H+ or K+/H+ antiporter
MTNFLKVAVLSIVMGLVVGGIVSLLLRHKEYLSISPVLETLYVMVGAYLAYALAHLPLFQLSGDVAIFFYGLMMSHYNKFNMNPETFKNIG